MEVADEVAVQFGPMISGGQRCPTPKATNLIVHSPYCRSGSLPLYIYYQTFPKFNTTIRWNYLIGGLNPIGYHVVNVILHGAVTLIFARVCRHQLETTWRTSLISAGLFAIHSIHTEAVSDLL